MFLLQGFLGVFLDVESDSRLSENLEQIKGNQKKQVELLFESSLELLVVLQPQYQLGDFREELLLQTHGLVNPRDAEKSAELQQSADHFDYLRNPGRGEVGATERLQRLDLSFQEAFQGVENLVDEDVLLPLHQGLNEEEERDEDFLVREENVLVQQVVDCAGEPALCDEEVELAVGPAGPELLCNDQVGLLLGLHLVEENGSQVLPENVFVAVGVLDQLRLRNKQGHNEESQVTLMRVSHYVE